MTVNSYNGGVSGNHTMHANILLAAKVAPMKPQIVVLMEAMNDFGTMLLTGSYWNDNLYRSMIVEEAGQRHADRWQEFLNGWRSVIRGVFPYTAEVLGKTRRWMLRNTEPEATDEFAGIRGVQLKPQLDVMLNAYAASLRMFVHTARAFAIQPVLMTQAHRLTENPDPVIKLTLSRLERDNGIDYVTYRETLLRFIETMRSVAAEEQVALIDLERLMPPHREFIYDTVHYNDTGSRRAAGIIASRLAQALMRR